MVTIRAGTSSDVDEAVSVYERSNLVRRSGIWPNRAARVEQVAKRIRDAESWFLVGADGEEIVGNEEGRHIDEWVTDFG